MTKKIVDIDLYRKNLTPEALLRLDPAESEKLFNRMPLKKQTELVMGAPWKKRMNIILMARNAQELVQALPREEIFWTVKEIGPLDALPLLSKTTYEQFAYMIDLDCWKKDRLDGKQIEAWLKILGKLNEEKVLDWFFQTDERLIISAFKTLLSVSKIEEETDISEEYDSMPPYSFDNVYYFHFRDNDARLVSVPLLHVVYQNNSKLFYQIADGLIWEFQPETEEEAFQIRQRRIAESGFPELEEALEIYQYLNEAEIEALAGEDFADRDAVHTRDDTPAHTLRYALVGKKGTLFLLSCIDRINNPRVLADVQQHLVALANKIIMADCLEINEIKNMELAVTKAQGYVNIGLEHISGRNEERALVFLEKIHPATLFRVGCRKVFDLKNRVKKAIFKDRESLPSFFDTPWSDVLYGLSRRRPLYYTGLLTEGRLVYRDFETLEEVKATGRAVDGMQSVDELLFDVFDLDWEDLATHCLQQTWLGSPQEIKAAAVFTTILAHHILYKKTAWCPLTVQELTGFIDRVFVKGADREAYHIPRDFRAAAYDWICSHKPFDELRKKALGTFVDTCINRLEEEFCGLIAQKTVDAQYVSSVLVQR